MPKLTIDNRSIDVPPGTKVIDAAEQLGIMIPRFCYHPALGSVGACRVCAVKVLEGRAKGIKMSCMLDAEDGMVVSTTDAEAVDFRRYVIEWLMLNHPHDCPVCDEGGHCLLQDMTVSGGHGLRRYQGPKRTHSDQDLGPLVQHEMNRCIQCYRCVRYYREYTGYEDLGVMGIGNRVYYGRFQEGTLESPFAGNLIDVCPTGVYTDKPSRFKGRRWDFERTPGLCIHCSLGCAITVDARYREVVRHEARFNPAVNGHFICDRGRYGYSYASAADRPWQAAVHGQPIDGPTALQTAGERLGARGRRTRPPGRGRGRIHALQPGDHGRTEPRLPRPGLAGTGFFRRNAPCLDGGYGCQSLADRARRRSAGHRSRGPGDRGGRRPGARSPHAGLGPAAGPAPGRRDCHRRSAAGGAALRF